MSDTPRTAAQAAGESIEQKIARLEREISAAQSSLAAYEQAAKGAPEEPVQSKHWMLPI